MGSKEQIFDHPSHTYTRALLSAAPVFTRKEKAEKKRVLLEGDLPTPFNPPKGCRFVSRSQLNNQPLQTDPGLHVCGPEHGNLPEAEHSGFHGDLLLMI